MWPQQVSDRQCKVCTHLVAACSSSWGWHSNTWTTGKHKSNSWIYSCIPHNWLLGIIPAQLTQNYLVLYLYNSLTTDCLVLYLYNSLTTDYIGIIPVQLPQNWVLHKSYCYNWVYQVDKYDNQAKSQLHFQLFCSPSPSLLACLKPCPNWPHNLYVHSYQNDHEQSNFLTTDCTDSKLWCHKRSVVWHKSNWWMNKKLFTLHDGNMTARNFMWSVNMKPFTVHISNRNFFNFMWSVNRKCFMVRISNMNARNLFTRYISIDKIQNIPKKLVGDSQK